MGSSRINFDSDSEIVRFGAIFEYCCDIVRILFLGAMSSDFWQKLRFVAVGQLLLRYRNHRNKGSSLSCRVLLEESGAVEGSGGAVEGSYRSYRGLLEEL